MNRRQTLGLLAAGCAALPNVARAETQDEVAANIEVVRRMHKEVFEAQSLEVIDQLVSPDYAAPADFQLAPGLDAYKARLQNKFQSEKQTWTGPITHEEIDIRGTGNVVARIGREKGTTKDGKLTNVLSTEWWELKDGLITTWYGGPDSGELSNQVYG